MQAHNFVLMWPSHVCVVAENLLNINYHAIQGFHLMRKGRATEPQAAAVPCHDLRALDPRFCSGSRWLLAQRRRRVR